MAAGHLMVDIGLTVARLQADMGKAVRIFGEGMKEMSGQVGFLKNSLTGLMSLGSLVALGRSAIQMGSELQDASEKFGVSASELMKLQLVAKMSGVEMEGVGNAIKFMSKAIADAVDPTSKQAFALKAIGVSLKDLQGKAPIDQFMMLADAFSKLEKDENVVSAALALFGKAGSDIIPVLSKGSAEIKKMSTEFQRLGAVLSDAEIAKLDDYGDAIEMLGFRLKATAGRMVVDWGAATDWMLRRNKESLDLVTKLNEAWYDLEKTMGLFAPSVKTGKLSEIIGLSPEEEAKKKAGNIAAMEEVEKARKKAEEEAQKERDRIKAAILKMDAETFAAQGKIAHDALAAEMGYDQEYFDTRTKMRLEDFSEWKKGQEEETKLLEKFDMEQIRGLGDLQDAQREEFEITEKIADYRAEDAFNAAMQWGNTEQAIRLLNEGLYEHFRILGEGREKVSALGNLYTTVFRGKDGVFADMAGVAINAFHGMTDALTDFVMTGKANFRDFANSVIADIMRIAIRQSIVQPIAGGLMSAFGMAAVPAMASGGPVFGGSPYMVGERGPELFVPSSSGSIVPGGGGGNVTVNVQNNTGQPIEKRNVRTSFDAQGMVVDMVLDAMNRNVHGLRTALGGA